MPSSPTDSRLEELAKLYDRALQALASDEVGRLASLLDRCDMILEDHDPSQSPDSASLIKARECQGRLSSAMVQAMAGTKAELNKLRRGRQDLRRFVRGSLAVGTRLHDEA